MLWFQVKNRQLSALFIQFGFFSALFSMSSAVSLTEKGCSNDYTRLAVNINGNIDCGNVYPLSSVGGPVVPEISFPSAKDNNQYTVVMIDPDAPSHSNPNYRSWLHYLAVNVQGKNVKQEVSLADLSPSVDYNPPSPPQGSGLHRYMIYVMQQTGSVNPGSFKTRASFDVDDFVANHNLTPVASNMFKTERQ